MKSSYPRQGFLGVTVKPALPVLSGHLCDKGQEPSCVQSSEGQMASPRELAVSVDTCGRRHSMCVGWGTLPVEEAGDDSVFGSGAGHTLPVEEPRDTRVACSGGF